MKTRRLKLTTAAIRPHLGKPCILWDTDQPGLGLAFRVKLATFFLLRKLRGMSAKLTIGRFGTWTPDAARRRARELIVQMDQRIDPQAKEREARAKGVTLRDAMESHVDAMRARGRAQRSMDDVRDLQLFILFTGLRKHGARTVKWADVDLDAGTIHHPQPKGGEDREFTVPVSAFLLDLLPRRLAENRELFPEGDGGFVSPTRDRQGRVVHVCEARIMRYENGKRLLAKLSSPHRLRDTFTTAAHEARLHPLDIKILINHRLLAGGDVTEGYIRPSEQHLRDCVERVAAFLLERAGERRKRDAG